MTIGNVYKEFEVLPTTKFYVYSDIDENLQKVPYHFTYKYSEDLVIKWESTDICVDSRHGDYLVDQYGFLIEVIDVNLDYCSGDIYYQLYTTGNTTNSDVIVFNGITGDTLTCDTISVTDINFCPRVIVSHKNEEFHCLNMKLEQYYIGGNCLTLPSTDDLDRFPEICDLPICSCVLHLQ